MKTIKAQIIVFVVSLTVAICVLLGILSCFLNYKTAVQVLEQNLIKTADVAGNLIGIEVELLQGVARELGLNPLLSDPTLSVAEKENIMNEHTSYFGISKNEIAGKDGISLFQGIDYNSANVYQKSIKGELAISGPIPNTETGGNEFFITAPLWEKGIEGGKIVGVVCLISDESLLEDIVNGLSISKTGLGYIIDNQGTYVASNEEGSIVGVQNNTELAKTDKKLVKLAEIESNMMAGKNSFGTYYFQGDTYVQGYAPIANTEGWSVGVYAVQDDFMGNFKLSLVLTTTMALLFIAVGSIIASKFAYRLSQPIIKCVERLVELGKGDLHTSVETSSRKDEIGVLQNTTSDIIGGLQGIVGDITELLKELADHNLDIASTLAYEGDFIPIRESIDLITESLNDAIGQMGAASEQVESGSNHVSLGAQELSEGATEQASAIEELAATMVEITEQIKKTADNAKQANKLSTIAEAEVKNGNQKMDEVIVAMERISNTSQEIARIIDTIDGIASQTNMLSLNAAIEAARVGAAGAGFAIVSDEIGNLAAESTKAAKNTAILIKDTLEAVEVGVKVVADTAKILLSIVESTQQTTDLVDGIALACNSQEESVQQISHGVDQIAVIVQTNAATAEESAAASEELTAQSTTLKDLVLKFNMKK